MKSINKILNEKVSNHFYKYSGISNGGERHYHLTTRHIFWPIRSLQIFTIIPEMLPMYNKEQMDDAWKLL